MPKLNVCLINDSFPPEIDGVANAVTNYAQIITEKFGTGGRTARSVPCRWCAIRALT